MRGLFVVALAAIVSFPSAAFAQSGHRAPTLLNRGSACSAVPGSGSVLVQVFVRKDGTFDVKNVIRSTNAANNPAALEIAANSTYQPAFTDGKPVDEFFDYQLTFAGPAPGVGASPEICSAIVLVHDGKYAEAKEKLGAFLQSHPTDAQANLYLGLADAFSKDNAGAAAAFDRAGTIEPKYANVALQAYIDRTQELLKSEKYADAVTAATKAIALQPANPSLYYMRGAAQERQNPSAALADLEKARTLATDAKLSNKDLAVIEARLVGAYASTGAVDRAQALAKEALAHDPGQAATVNDALFAAYFNAGTALSAGGKYADAVARFEAGAAAVPSRAGSLYARAALTLATDKTPDWKKVKVEADKALAADPSDGLANFVAAAALAKDGKPKDAVPFLNKAKSSPLYTSDVAFAKQVDDALKAIGSSGK
jgi:tetratricopeptide (TPR) repeat protein